MNESIEIKISKSNHPIPVINQIHLHSIYNPIKEAEAFARSSEKKLKASSKILIFGLGFGYHIQAIEKRLQALYNDGYEITVVEPCQKLITLWKDYRQVNTSSRVRIVSFDTIQKFYDDVLLTDFLASKPSIISHTASFQLNENFYKSFMSFTYPNDTRSSSKFIENLELKKVLESSNHLRTVDLFDEAATKESRNQWDFLTLALKQFTNQDKA